MDRSAEVLAVRDDPRPWIEANLFLRTKDQRIVPFHFWPVQAHYWSQRSRWDVILKARQMGFTSLICAMFFADTVLRANTVSAMVAHDGDSSEKIFGIVKLFWERLPEEERRRIGEPKYFTRREFYWPRLNSRFYVGTAGSLAFGRGQTINNLHCSEFAYWPRPEEALVALTEAVPLTGHRDRVHRLWHGELLPRPVGAGKAGREPVPVSLLSLVVGPGVSAAGTSVGGPDRRGAAAEAGPRPER